jgi:hypothetical protein
VVSTAFKGEEKPTCCRFLEKYSAVLLLVILLKRGYLGPHYTKNEKKIAVIPIDLAR